VRQRLACDLWLLGDTFASQFSECHGYDAKHDEAGVEMRTGATSSILIRAGPDALTLTLAGQLSKAVLNRLHGVGGILLQVARTSGRADCSIPSVCSALARSVSRKLLSREHSSEENRPNPTALPIPIRLMNQVAGTATWPHIRFTMACSFHTWHKVQPSST